jgi:hypothetical protein
MSFVDGLIVLFFRTFALAEALVDIDPLRVVVLVLVYLALVRLGGGYGG